MQLSVERYSEKFTDSFERQVIFLQRIEIANDKTRLHHDRQVKP